MASKYRVEKVLVGMAPEEKAALLASWEQVWHEAKLAKEAKAAVSGMKAAGLFSSNYYDAALAA